jgi:hypothetical protein
LHKILNTHEELLNKSLNVDTLKRLFFETQILKSLLLTSEENLLSDQAYRKLFEENIPI